MSTTTSIGNNVEVLGNVNIQTGKTYQINNTSVLSETTLGENITSSSLTTLGELSDLSVSGSIISSTLGVYERTCTSYSLATATLINVNFDTETTNTGSIGLSYSTSTYQITNNSGRDLTVFGTAYIQFAASTTGYRVVRLNENGTSTLAVTMNASSSSTTDIILPFLKVIPSTQYIGIRAYHTAGANLTLTGKVSLHVLN